MILEQKSGRLLKFNPYESAVIKLSLFNNIIALSISFDVTHLTSLEAISSLEVVPTIILKWFSVLKQLCFKLSTSPSLIPV